MNDEEWQLMQRGVCTDPSVDPEFWYSESVEDQIDARRICRSCPAVEVCLTLTIEEEAKNGYTAHGVRGGMLARERQKILDVRRAAARAGLTRRTK